MGKMFTLSKRQKRFVVKHYRAECRSQGQKPCPMDDDFAPIQFGERIDFVTGLRHVNHAFLTDEDESDLFAHHHGLDVDFPLKDGRAEVDLYLYSEDGLIGNLGLRLSQDKPGAALKLYETNDYAGVSWQPCGPIY